MYGMGQHSLGIWYRVFSMVFNIGHARGYTVHAIHVGMHVGMHADMLVLDLI